MAKIAKVALGLLAGFTSLSLGVIIYAYAWGLIPYKPDTDRLSLEATAPLDCIYISTLSASARSAPNSCNHWWLHNRETGYVYVRWACYNG
jgi:hypothetical protein